MAIGTVDVYRFAMGWWSKKPPVVTAPVVTAPVVIRRYSEADASGLRKTHLSDAAAPRRVTVTSADALRRVSD